MTRAVMTMRGAVLCLVVMAACGGTEDPPYVPPWNPELPPAAELGVRRGLTPARGIIHLHSAYSHDACDGDPRPGGAPDEACLASLRTALCRTRMDYAALTDHDASMADEDFETLFSMRGADEAVRDGLGAQIASRLVCPDGHRVLVFVGGENNLMPIMLDGHPPAPTIAERHDIYNGDDTISAQAFRDAGGLVWFAHTEGETVDHVRDIAPHGIEVYQLHANLDPDIRMNELGLPAFEGFAQVLQFNDPAATGPEPDLAMLAFVLPNTPSLDLWDQLLGEGVRLMGSAGTDAHENTLPGLMRDGERGDSYRRILRWFSNVVLTDDPTDAVALERDLARGRMFSAFEVFGTPVGFDVHATGGATAELGDEVLATAGATLSVAVPTVYQLDPLVTPPTMFARIYRLDAGGRTMVAEGAGPTLSVALDQVGAYRVEIHITPLHLGPNLGDLGTALAENTYVWIYANPIYVR